MKKITATFRVVTPLFMSGADQTKAELRLASIKGALRFWWRALAWAEYQGDMKAIHQAESELFGSADQKIGQAKVLMKLELPENATSYIKTQKASDWKINQWESYVGYGLVDKTTRPHRQYIAAKGKSPFQFTLTCIAKESADLSALMPAIQIFGLLGNLGGRARKGWGSISLEQCSSSVACQGLATWSAPQNADAYHQQLDTLLADTQKCQALPPYTAFSAQSRIETGTITRDAQQAQRHLASLYKETVSTSPNKRHRQQFGLPRQPFNSQDRRASPVFLHVHHLANEQALPVIAFLPAQFLSNRNHAPGNNDRVQVLLRSLRGSHI